MASSRLRLSILKLLITFWLCDVAFFKVNLIFEKNKVRVRMIYHSTRDLSNGV